MNRPIIFTCITLGAILALSYQLLAPKADIDNYQQDTAFEKYQLRNELEYKLTYEPQELKEKLAVSNSESDWMKESAFQDHHYFNLRITNTGLNRDSNPVQGYEDLSEYLNDEFKNQFELIINGERKPCVLHHAFNMPQRKNVLVLQMVFRDEGFIGQKDYFQDGANMIFYDHKNNEQLNWAFTAEELNSTPILNIKHNG